MDIFNQLKINPENPRILKDTKFTKLKNSIKEFPRMLEIRPIVYDAEFMVLGGNMRLQALKELIGEGFEIKDKYFLSVDDLTEDQKKRFIIEDNVMFGEWDWDMLANGWDKELLLDWGLDVIDYHEVNDLHPDEFESLGEIETDDLYHINIAFDTEEELKQFLQEKNIILDNNYMRRNKTISLNWPLEIKKDVKSVKAEI